MSRFETAEDSFSKANKLFVEEEYDKALKHYTDAIELCSDEKQFSEYYEKRCTCNYQLENFTDAISDADAALKYNPSNVAAILRKGMSFFALNEYESAKATFEAGLKIDANHSKLKTWLNKANAELAQEKAAAAKKAAPAPAAKQPEATPAPAQQQQPAVQAPPPSIRNRIKVQHYQNVSEVIVDILGLKDIPVANRQVRLEDDKVIISMKIPNENEPFERTLELYSEINAAESKINSGNVKTELILKKKVKSLEWPTLEKSQAAAKPFAEASASNVDIRKYPSSKGAKNWDSIEEEVKKDKEEEGDPLTKLFQQIYSGADEDTKRAMIKSFSESGGTVLSTNWKEVGKEKVKVQAPDGMQPKKYNE